jgi:hypothetical protein
MASYHAVAVEGSFTKGVVENAIFHFNAIGHLFVAVKSYYDDAVVF